MFLIALLQSAGDNYNAGAIDIGLLTEPGVFKVRCSMFPFPNWMSTGVGFILLDPGQHPIEIT
jgi:hypothetical protein